MMKLWTSIDVLTEYKTLNDKGKCMKEIQCGSLKGGGGRKREKEDQGEDGEKRQKVWQRKSLKVKEKDRTRGNLKELAAQQAAINPPQQTLTE